jgi:hypothetical protein
MRKLVAGMVAFLVVACGGAVNDPAAGTLKQEEGAQSTTQNRGKDRVCGRTFRGPSEGTTVSVVEYPVVHNLFTGTAVLTGVGHSQIVFPHDWSIVDRSVNGSMTITAANGDELFASVTGTAFPHPDGLTMVLEQSGNFEGGTGRFAEASGSFSIVGTLTRATGAVSVWMDGRLIRDVPCD